MPPAAFPEPAPAVWRTAIMSLIALVVVAIIIIAVLPTWPYSAGWGYGPTGALTFVLVVLLVLMLLGHL